MSVGFAPNWLQSVSRAIVGATGNTQRKVSMARCGKCGREVPNSPCECGAYRCDTCPVDCCEAASGRVLALLALVEPALLLDSENRRLVSEAVARWEEVEELEGLLGG